jgi:hypothetical protein
MDHHESSPPLKPQISHHVILVFVKFSIDPQSVTFKFLDLFFKQHTFKCTHLLKLSSIHKDEKIFVNFEVFTAVKIQIEVFWGEHFTLKLEAA